MIDPFAEMPSDRARLYEAEKKLRNASFEIERLRGELDECRRLLREALQACEVYLPVAPDDETRIALLTLEWYEAAQAAGGDL